MIGPHAATAADVYWESSWPQDFRNWIAPQIFVEPTFAAYRSNQDAAMNATLGLAPWVPISQHPGFGASPNNRWIQMSRTNRKPPAAH